MATHGAISSERSPETICVTSTHWVNEQIPTWKWVGKAETHCARNPTMGTVSHSQDGTFNPQLLPHKRRAWTLHLAPQHFRLSPEGWAPKTPTSQSQRDLHPQDPQD